MVQLDNKITLAQLCEALARKKKKEISQEILSAQTVRHSVFEDEKKQHKIDVESLIIEDKEIGNILGFLSNFDETSNTLHKGIMVSYVDRPVGYLMPMTDFYRSLYFVKGNVKISPIILCNGGAFYVSKKELFLSESKKIKVWDDQITALQRSLLIDYAKEYELEAILKLSENGDICLENYVLPDLTKSISV